MKLRNRKYTTGWLAVLVFGLMVAVGCDDPYGNRIDYSKLQKEEADLRMEFFKNVKDSLMRISSDSIVDMEDNGWVSYEIEKGSTDSVLVNKRVAFKFTYYYVARDKNGKPQRYRIDSNVGTGEVVTYTVGAIGQQDTKVLMGVDLAIRYMRLYGKSYIIMPHSSAYNDYYPVVAEIEVVAMDLD